MMPWSSCECALAAPVRWHFCQHLLGPVCKAKMACCMASRTFRPGDKRESPRLHACCTNKHMQLGVGEKEPAAMGVPTPPMSASSALRLRPRCVVKG